jgi:hypothetical protein
MDHFLRPVCALTSSTRDGPDASAVVRLHGFPQQPSSFEAGSMLKGCER